MSLKATSHGLLPHASAELKGHFVPACRDIFMSATISVDFRLMKWVTNTDGTAYTHEAKVNNLESVILLLTVSPLHEIGEVRVQLEDDQGYVDDDMRTWHRVQLDSSTLRQTEQRIVRVGKRAASLTQVCGTEQQEVPAGNGEYLREKKEYFGFSNDDDVLVDNLDGGEGSEGEVLELVFSSGDEGDSGGKDDGDGNWHKDSDEGAEEEPHMSLDGDGKMGTQFMLTLPLFIADGMEKTEGRLLRMVRCCIEVALIPLAQLAKVSVPRITMASGMECLHTSEVFLPSDDDYILLVGQRLYDYFICPRVAYAEGSSDSACFRAVDVHVTAVSTSFPDMAQWEVRSLKALPVLPEDFLCVFLRNHRNDHMLPPSEEIHAQVKWRVQHHPAYTLLSADSHERMGFGGVMSFYFFHCDHTMCDFLFPLIEALHLSWSAITSSAAQKTTAPHDGDTTWVVSGSSNSLLSLRRGVLCMYGAVVVAAEVLRAIRAPLTSPKIFYADALRGKTAVLTAVLELKWRMAAARCKDVPEFTWNPSTVAVTRAWALCLLCDESGWTELLRQERQIASCAFLIGGREDLWWLPSRYVWEVQDTLLFLSSAFVVTSIRQGLCYPWQLLQMERETLGNKGWLGSFSETNVPISSGIQFSLVRHLTLFWMPRLRYQHRQLQQARWQEERGKVEMHSNVGVSPCIVFVGSVNYEEKVRPAGRRDIRLQLKIPKTEFAKQLLESSGRVVEGMWDFDVPFALLYFSVELSESLSRAVVSPVKDEALPTCHATHLVQCCWRVSGLDWVKGLGQHTSFSVLIESQGGSEGSVKVRCRDSEQDDDEDNIQDKNTMSSSTVHIPLLVLNSRNIPAALMLSIHHSQFWSNLSSPIDILARRAVVRHIMEKAVQEGEDCVEEAKLLFTPLVNQLLKDLLGECRCPATEKDILPLESIFLPALRSTANRNALDTEAFSHRVHPDTYARFMRLCQKSSPKLHSSNFLAKRKRDDDNEGQLDGVVKDVVGKLSHHLQILTAYHASLPPQQRQKRRRLVLGLRRTSAVTETVEQVWAGAVRSFTPAEIATMIGRVLTCCTESSEKDRISARTAALSMVLPLWLLLQQQQNEYPMPPVEKTETVDAAQTIYKFICNDDASDAVVLKAYECFMSDSK